MNFPNKEYSVIYADPPWSYRQHGTSPKSRGNAAQHYRTMNVEDICSLPVRRLAGGGYRMCPIHVGDVPRIELFARQHAPGLDVWGDEVDLEVIDNG